MRITIRAAAIVLVTQGASCFFSGMMLAARQKTRSMAPVKKNGRQKKYSRQKNRYDKNSPEKISHEENNEKKGGHPKNSR